jgi:hypothetical protein
MMSNPDADVSGAVEDHCPTELSSGSVEDKHSSTSQTAVVDVQQSAKPDEG